MKSNTTKTYPYSGNYYGYTLVTSADGTVTERKYNEFFTIVNMALTVNLLGELVIESESKMQLNGYISNVLDKNDENIYVDGVWQITQTAPLLGPLGIKGGYKYRARLIEGQI
jgi:hypothetical protein